MQQTQYYKTVRASEPPKEEGIYMTKWKGVPAFTEKEFKDGEWQTRFENTGLMTHWLEPIPIPDAEVLRMALSDISEMIDTNRQPSLNQIRAIAREALSTSDGWVRVEEYDVPMVKHISNSHWITDGKDVYLAYKAGDNWFSKEDKKLPKAFIPTHIKPHTKPSPPQPINP